MSNEIPADKLLLAHENIAEIGMTVGALIADGHLPKQHLDLPSGVISAAIVQWAFEFEDKYDGGKRAPDWYEQLSEIGNPMGYMDAIDNFTTKKLFENNWLTDEYVSTIKWLLPEQKPKVLTVIRSVSLDYNDTDPPIFVSHLTVDALMDRIERARNEGYTIEYKSE